MQDSYQELEDQLSQFFKVHLSRLKFMSRLLSAMIHLRTVNYSDLALGLNSKVATASNYKRIQRFFRFFDFPHQCLSTFIWGLFVGPDQEVVLSLDRTNWKFGKRNINILMLSYCHHGLAIPLVWTLLGDKRGNSSQAERITLMERFLEYFSLDFPIKLVADREFVGKRWLEWLDDHHIHYVIRIRKNQLIHTSALKQVQAWTCFQSSSLRTFRKPREIFGLKLYICGQALEKGDYLILVSNLPLKKGLFYYAKRWEIEVLFGALKSRGFRFEETHVSKPERIDKLVAIMSLALVWAIKAGEFLIKKGKKIPIKKHKRKAISIFRLGLDEIRTKLIHHMPLNELIQLLSCT